MRPNLPTFNKALVGGVVLAILVLWLVSLWYAASFRDHGDAADQQTAWRAQLRQLQARQEAWLREQYYTLKTLYEVTGSNAGFQSHLLDYYRRNPSIWAVTLVPFDAAGNPVSQSAKPGCTQPQDIRRARFIKPVTTSCRVDDKALLEIAGLVSTESGASVILISMDYFDFLREFAALTGRELERAEDNGRGAQYREYGAGNGARVVTLSLTAARGLRGELHLVAPGQSFGRLFREQAPVVLPLVALCGLALLALLHFNLVRPLMNLASGMRRAARSQQIPLPEDNTDVRAGLDELQAYFSEMQQMAKSDPVTGLNNRVIFEDRLAQAIRESKRSGRKYALVLIDVHGLDAVAQQRGRYIVDALLRRIAESLRQALRESDHVARFEASLFALLLEVGQRDQLDALVEKIYLSVVRRHQAHGREFEPTACFGVAIYPDHALDAATLYQDASDALLRAEQGEWPIQMYRENEATDTSGFTLIQQLRRAIDEDQLKLVFQPVVDLASFEIVYLEALLRWRRPEEHDRPIERTIRLAEQSHLIRPLTNWILESACRFVAESPIKDLTVGVNLSMVDLHDRQLPERIEGFIRRYGIRPAQLVIEITEGQIMQEPAEVIEILAHIGVMGVSLSIDDFGTGQASFTYLKELPVEKLKIDKSFVRDMDSNPDDQLIVKATIELAHTLDIKVVAEGVETLAIYNQLLEMNCDYVQGFYISRPLEGYQVADWVETSVRPDLVNRD